MAVNCSSTADCGDGETCVAGDSATSIQACVAGAACGGSSSGNCPADATSGQLACIQRDGVYKCLSIDRCDQYFGGSSCSAGCSVNGVQCNGQGSCNLFQFYSHKRFERGFQFSYQLFRDFHIVVYGCIDVFYSTSKSSSRSSSTSASVSGSSSSSSSSNGSLSSSSSSSRSSSSRASSSGASNEQVNPASANSGSVASESDSGGTSSAVFIIIGILAACIIVGALMFAMYSRKKKREQEAEAGGFGGAAAFGATAGGDSELGGGHGGSTTPKSSIVTM
ncbi:Glycoside hydrolase [Phytophthora megakarya]|uniref:Glycoside hydrolase n=1 Tax=Phytophthora megakarya TaxID=4795 RepID=A0A225VKM7_9STRA|nr:Glycoside hydrolase [Phytophthora megakarya]